jgi:hypothetical protein
VEVGLSNELEIQVQQAIEKQGKVWIKALAIVVIQTVGICAFAFTLRADVTRNSEKIAFDSHRIERLEADQRELIRVVVTIENIQKQISEIAAKIAMR